VGANLRGTSKALVFVLFLFLFVDSVRTSDYLLIYFGLQSGGATPVPIPNMAVKPSSADGTAAPMLWESKTGPG
jgi:hypothetical protein